MEYRENRFLGVKSQEELDARKAEWDALQLSLGKQIIQKDDFDWMVDSESEDSGGGGSGRRLLRYVGALFLGFSKADPNQGCATLLIMAYPSLEVVYRRMNMVSISQPYMPSYLAFRELDAFKDLWSEMLERDAEIKPDVVFLNGNGYFHPRRCGVATHIGVELDVPTIGVTKNFFQMEGLAMTPMRWEFKEKCKELDDWMPVKSKEVILVDDQTEEEIGYDVLGAAINMTGEGGRPLYVSVGHRISLETAVEVVKMTSEHRFPEPLRQADLSSRDFVNTGKFKDRY